jgi:hypothetical protein
VSVGQKREVTGIRLRGIVFPEKLPAMLDPVRVPPLVMDGIYASWNYGGRAHAKRVCSAEF